jgi:excisionase family DNA binding protein
MRDAHYCSGKELARIEDDLPRYKQQPLWTVDEVAAYLRIKPTTVRAMCRRGDLPAIKVGKAWRFDKFQLDEQIQHETTHE